RFTDAMADSMPSINSLYAGHTVFLTGGSGFVGKVVIEKFLHAVPDVKKIFMLCRAAKGKSAQERWDDISKGVIFNRVRADRPDAFSKVVPVEGDITIDDMGLNEADLKAVLEETSVVIHCAATVRFNDTLRSAIELNLKGVDRMIKMCKRMPLLECFLHCSTAYVNVDKEGDIEEKQYDAVCDPYKVIDGQGWMTDDMLDGITLSMSKRYFNTYCFTKHVAEELVKRECENQLPTIIFRPSIIAGVWKDGIPGWADAFQGISANALGFGTGTIPRMPCNAKNPIDVIPVDCVSNMIITCAAYRLHLTNLKDRDTMPILHCSTSHMNPLTIEFYRNTAGEVLDKYPLEKILFAPCASTRGYPVVEDSIHKFKESVVGPSLDKFGALMGKKPFWGRTFAKLREVYSVFIPFVSKRWIYKSNNMIALIDRMHPDDLEKFDFDIRKIDWTAYVSDVVFGMRCFLTKNDMMSDEKIVKLRRTVRIHQGVEFIGNLFLGWILSIFLTGSLSSWAVALVVGLSIYYYFQCNMNSPAKYTTIESYRERMTAALRSEGS
ncbi:hypothetical protein PFISCL1PPCAC_28179, partial [Pristionchus fissidentatus]